MVMPKNKVFNNKGSPELRIQSCEYEANSWACHLGACDDAC